MHGCMHDHACMKACMNLCMYVWMHVDKPHHLAIYSIFSLCGAAPPDFCRQERQKGVFTCCWRISWQETKTQLGPRTRGQNWEYDTLWYLFSRDIPVRLAVIWEHPPEKLRIIQTNFSNSHLDSLYVCMYVYIYSVYCELSYAYIYTQYIDMIYIYSTYIIYTQ